MSEYGWNHVWSEVQDVRYGHAYGMNHARRLPPYCSTQCANQIACRLCDQVFTSTRDLITHVEFHMREDGRPSRRQTEINLLPFQRERNLFANPFRPAPPLPETCSSIQNGCPSPLRHQMREANLPFNAHQLLACPTQQVLSSAASNCGLGPQPMAYFLQAEVLVKEKEISSDLTMPYLNQLEQPIPDIVQLIESNDNCNKMDLTLRL